MLQISPNAFGRSFSGVGIIRRNAKHLGRELGRRGMAVLQEDVGAVVTAVPTIVEKTSTIISCKTADQRSRQSTVGGSSDFEDTLIGEVADAVQSISFFIGRSVGSITLLAA